MVAGNRYVQELQAAWQAGSSTAGGRNAASAGVRGGEKSGNGRWQVVGAGGRTAEPVAGSRTTQTQAGIRGNARSNGVDPVAGRQQERRGRTPPPGRTIEPKAVLGVGSRQWENPNL